MAQGEGGEVFGIIFLDDNILQHCSPTLAENVGRHARQFYVCVF
jgi:hypothetical protein